MTPTTPGLEPSAVTQSLIDLLRKRDAAGKAKYGTSLDRTDLTAEQWIQHATEELLDAAGYLQSLARTLRQGPLVPQVDAPKPAVRCFVDDDYLWAHDDHPDGPMTFGLHSPWVKRVKGIALADLQKPNSEIKPITYADALARLADRPKQQAKLRAMGE